MLQSRKNRISRWVSQWVSDSEQRRRIRRRKASKADRRALEVLEDRQLLTVVAGTTRVAAATGSSSLQLLHASDLECGVDAVDRAAAFAAIIDVPESDAAANNNGSPLLSAGDNFIGWSLFSAAGDFALRRPLH